MARIVSRVGDQLVLEGIMRQCEYVVVPWDGRSPRELTASFERFILQRKRQKSVSDFVRTGQYEMWPANKKGPRQSPVAPLLLPLDRS